MTTQNCRFELSSERQGFALAGALLAMVVVGALITGSFFAASQENAIGLSSRYNDEATYTAEYAINQAIEQVPVSVLKNLTSDMVLTYSASPSDTIKYAVVNGQTIGRAVVWVHPSGPNRLFIARAEAVRGDSRYTGGTRVLGLMTHMKIPVFNTDRAIQTFGGLNAGGNSLVSGQDVIPTGAGAPQWSQPGVCDPLTGLKTGVVAKDATQVTQSGSAQIEGNPPVAEDPSMDITQFDNFGDVTYNSLVSLASKTYTAATIPHDPFPSVDANGLCDTADPSNWGEPGVPNGGAGYVAACSNYFPVIHITGDCSQTASVNSQGRGQGILLVDTNLDITGGFEFWGITIVRCNLSAKGTGGKGGHLNGTVMTLNSSDLSYDDVTLGNSVVELSTCAVNRAAQNIPGLNVAIPLRQHSFIDLTAAGAGF